MKNQDSKSGIRLFLVIPCENVIPFLLGATVRAWPSYPGLGCPDFNRPTKSDREEYFPKGATQMRIDTEKVKVRGFMNGTFTIQIRGGGREFSAKEVRAVIKASKTAAAKIIGTTKVVRDYYAGRTGKSGDKAMHQAPKSSGQPQRRENVLDTR